MNRARRSNRAIPSALATLATLGVMTAATISAGDSTETIAVVEFRSGSTAAPDLGARVARMLTVKTGLAVTAPDAARQQFGPRLDAAVKACGDDPNCLARLGSKLGVDEILLVGLSELGDVIVTIQRVIVATARVDGTLAETLVGGKSPSDEQLETFLRAVMPANRFEQWGRIQIESNVESATIRVNGTKRGVTPLAPITVKAPDSYDVAVGKSGYSEFRARIAVTPDALVVVKPELSLVPTDAWYKKWWVLALAGAVTAGAVTTAVVLSRDAPNDVPVMVEPF